MKPLRICQRILRSTFPVCFQEEIGAAAGYNVVQPDQIEWEYGTIEYYIKGQGNPVVISHGAGGGYDQGLFWGERLFSGHQIIAISRFGYLGSSLPANPSNQLQAAAFAQVFAKHNIKKAIIAGFSAGGPAAIEFAINYPEACEDLILGSAINNPALHRSKKSSEGVGPLFRLMLNSDLVFNIVSGLFRSKLLKMFGVSQSSQKLMTPDEKEFLNQIISTMKPITRRRLGNFNDMHLPVIDETEIMKITAPTLIFHAVDDLLVPVNNGEYAARTIPNAQFVKYEKGGHLLLGHHQEIELAIKGFLEGIGSAAAVYHPESGR